MGLLDDARGWLTDQLQLANEVTVTYTRGATSISISAVVGRTVFASNETGAPRLVFGDRDYLIRVSDLVFDARVVEPRSGDRIAETIDGTGYVFEVLEPDAGEPSWRYSDPGRGEYRVHTKRVK